MNKLILLVLAVCLISAHAFVKRETEAAAPENGLDQIQKQFQETVKQLQEKAAETFNLEEIGKNLKSITDAFEKAVNDFKTNIEKKD